MELNGWFEIIGGQLREDKAAQLKQSPRGGINQENIGDQLMRYWGSVKRIMEMENYKQEKKKSRYTSVRKNDQEVC